MPVVLRVGGFVFSIYMNDHPPAHAHACYSGGSVVVEIESEWFRDVHRMSKADVNAAVRLVQAHRAELLAAWKRLHPDRET